jgi:hypothetical protein
VQKKCSAHPQERGSAQKDTKITDELMVVEEKPGPKHRFNTSSDSRDPKFFVIFAIFCAKNVPPIRRKENPHSRTQKSQKSIFQSSIIRQIPFLRMSSWKLISRPKGF